MSRGTRRPKKRKLTTTQDFLWYGRGELFDAVPVKRKKRPGPMSDPASRLCKSCGFEARNGHAPGCPGEEKE